MIKIGILCCLLLISIQSEVIELTDQTFQEFITKNSYVFLYFYSPSCRHCKMLQPEFLKLSMDQFSQPNVKFGKIDAIKYEKLSEKYKVQGYPSLFFFDNAFTMPFEEGRSYEQMSKQIKNYFTDRVNRIQKDELTSKQTPYIIIQEGTLEQNKVLNQSIYGLNDVKAYSIGEGNKGKIKAVTKKGEIQYTDIIQRANLRQWILSKLGATIISLDNENNVKNYIFESNKSSLVLVLTNKDKQNKKIYDIIKQTCEKNIEKIHCLQILQEYRSYKGVHNYFKVKDTSSSIIGLIKQKMNIAYSMEVLFDNITQENLEQFIENAINDRINRVVDNVVPSNIQFNIVKSLTAETLNQILSNNQYVFINFYQPNDQASRFFSKTFQKFAKDIQQYKDINVVAGAINCVQNKQLCKKYGINYYPTLLLEIDNAFVEYKKTQKLPEVQNLIKYITEIKNKKVQILQNEQQIKQIQKPAILITGKQLTNQMKLCSAQLWSIRCYFIQNKDKQASIKLQLDNQIVQYTGELKLKNLSKWIRKLINELISDLMKQEQDKKIMEGVNKKQSVIFLLDVDKDNSIRNQLSLGFICQKNKLLAGYSDSNDPSFDSLMEWVGLQRPTQSLIIFSQTKTDKRYLYPQSINQFNEESFLNFVKAIQTGKIKSIDQDNSQDQATIESQDIQTEVLDIKQMEQL